jgi:hypothetical protein
LDAKDAHNEHLIKPGRLGAVNATFDVVDNIYGADIVQWAGKAFPLQEPMLVEECGSVPMDIGTMVVWGRKWSRVVANPGCIQPPPDGAEKKLYWVRNILRGFMKNNRCDGGTHTMTPPKPEHLHAYNAEMGSKCRHIHEHEHEVANSEKKFVAEMELVEIVKSEELEEFKDTEKEDARKKQEAEAAKHKAATLRALLPKKRRTKQKPKEDGAKKPAAKRRSTSANKSKKSKDAPVLGFNK